MTDIGYKPKNEFDLYCIKMLMYSIISVFINFCIKILYKFHELFEYESSENNFDLAIKDVKVNPRSSLEHSGAKSSKLSVISYVPAFSHVCSCHKISQSHPKVII